MIRVIIRGIRAPGFTSVRKSSAITPSRTSTTAISMMRWPRPARPPVVSTSTTA